jgi:glycerate kinase
MHILVAPNAFKNSLSAAKAANAIRQGLMESALDCSCECFPVGDGGDGTAELIIHKCGGEWVYTEVQDPLGKKIPAGFGIVENGHTAVIEMANASGLRLLQAAELHPMRATTYGTGEQLRAALNRGVQKIIIGMGGSATVDGGSGILKALGIRFLNVAGEELVHLPEDLSTLASVDLTALDKRIKATELVVLCDVNNLLLGENGAAAVFGKQKGAGPYEVVHLNAVLAQLAAVALQQTGKDMANTLYSGTAGGAAAGLFAFLDAQLVNGIEYFLSLTGFDAALQKANLVITAEGSIDEQTLQGKGPFGVARRAKEKGLPVIGLAGKVPPERNELLQQYFDVLLPIGHHPASLPAAMAATESDLLRTATALGNLLALQAPVFKT